MSYKTDASRASRYFALFATAFLTSLTANSGFAIIASMKNIFVVKKQWIPEDEMNDCITLAQSAPGMMAVNLALIVGYQTAGVFGSFLAVLGTVLPPFAAMLGVTYFYRIITGNIYVRIFMGGMQAGVTAMLLDILIGLFRPFWKDRSVYPFILIILSFLYIRYLNASVFFLALFCILCGAVRTILYHRERKRS